MPKILIIRFSSIGDIVLTTPVIRCIKQQLPGAEVHFCTKVKFQSLLQTNPYLSKIHVMDKGLGTLVTQLKQEQFDYVIDLHHNLRTQIIKWRLGVKSFSFDKLNWRKWLLVNLKINQMPNTHIVDRYMATTASLGVKNDLQGLDYFIPVSDYVQPVVLGNAFQGEYVVFAIGAQHFTKRLPPEKIIEFCKQIDLPIVLLGGKEDAEVGNYVEQILQAFGKTIKNSCGQWNLNQSASLVQQATYVISHDTGLMHIAAAFKKKIYSVWGNTTPLFGMYPYQTAYKVIENNTLSCRPCSKIGYHQCPKGHFNCMNTLTLEV